MGVKKILSLLLLATTICSAFCKETNAHKDLKSDLSPTSTIELKNNGAESEKTLEDCLEEATKTGILNLAGMFKDESDPDDMADEFLARVANACDTPITTISLEDNNLKYIPEILFTFKFINFLFLSNNQIDIIPVQISYLKNLVQLEINRNKLVTIPNIIGVSNKLLKKLYLKENNLKNISQTICNLEKLEELDLSNNKIKMVPENFAFLQKLDFLDLHNNLITTLPAEIKNLKYLSWLSLYNNPLNNETKNLLLQIKQQRPQINIIL